MLYFIHGVVNPEGKTSIVLIKYSACIRMSVIVASLVRNSLFANQPGKIPSHKPTYED